MSSRAGWQGLIAVAALALGGCVIVPAQQHALVSLGAGGVAERRAACAGGASAADFDPGAGALDPALLRVVSWNLHKQSDDGWQDVLAALAAQSDVLLLQEAALTPELRSMLGRAGYAWVMASSFAWVGTEYGVVIAARVRPLSFCTGRAFEPLTGIPKSYLVARFRLAGREAPLAVATLHALNFTLELWRYEEQLDELGRVLAAHVGPIVLAGDFNTWNDAREAAGTALAARLGLEAAVFAPDTRSRFLGHAVDRAYARGAQAQAAAAPEVAASDHHPLVVTLRIP